MAPGVHGRDAGQSVWRLSDTYSRGQIHKAIRSSPLLCLASCLDPSTDMILTTKLLKQKSRMRADQAEHKESFRPGLSQQGGIGHGGCRCCPRGCLRTHASNDRRENNSGRGRATETGVSWNTEYARTDQYLWTSLLVLCYCLRPLVQKWCDQGFCVDIDCNPWKHGHTRTISFWQLEVPGN